jgi:hypothetical protein
MCAPPPLSVVFVHRKHGHNEIDEPMFTQPLMYKKIRQHKNAHQQYVERLLTEGSVSKQQVRLFGTVLWLSRVPGLGVQGSDRGQRQQAAGEGVAWAGVTCCCLLMKLFQPCG